MRVIFLPCIASLVAVACGKMNPQVTVVSGTPSPQASSAAAQEANAVSLSAEPNWGESVGTRGEAVQIHTMVALPGFSRETAAFQIAKVSTKLTVRREEGGKIVFEASKPGTSVSWEIAVPEEGWYVAEAQAHHENPDIVPASRVWTKRFRVDRTPPSLAVTAQVTTNPVSGDRKVILTAQLPADESARCGEIALIDPQSKEVLAQGPLQMQSEGRFVSAALSFIPKRLGSMIADVECSDEVGNPTRTRAVISPDAVSFQAAMKLLGKVSEIDLDGTKRSVTFLRPGNLQIQPTLVDIQSAQALAAAVVAQESPRVRLYVSEEEFDSPQALKAALAIPSKMVAQYPLQETLTYPLRDGILGYKRLFLTLGIASASGELERLVNIIPLDIFVDRAAPKLTWRSKPSFAPAALNKVLPVSLGVEATGAPWDKAPQIEWSSDGVAWSPIEIQNVNTSADGVQFEVKYPFDTERPFRLRAKVKDLAGNEAVSGLSPVLVGASDFDATMSDAARDACKSASGAAAGKLVPRLASRVLCKVRLQSGEVGTTSAATVALLNGGRAPILPVGSAVNMGSRILSGSTTLAWPEFDAAPFSQSVMAEPRFVQYVLDSEILAQQSLVLEWDILEDTNAQGQRLYSTTPDVACYAHDGVFRPRVTIQDAAKPLVVSPFPCDALE